jgi:tripartite-type tricarboxylate transporter receptor subunit TctC
MVKSVTSPETRSKLQALGAEAAGTSADEFAAMIRREWALHAKIIKAAGLKVD